MDTIIAGIFVGVWLKKKKIPKSAARGRILRTCRIYWFASLLKKLICTENVWHSVPLRTTSKFSGFHIFSLLVVSPTPYVFYFFPPQRIFIRVFLIFSRLLTFRFCSLFSKVLLNRCIHTPSEQVTNSVFSKTGLTDFLQEASEDIQVSWREIVYMCLLAVLFSAIVLLLFRFVAGFIIWVILGCVSLACIAGTIYLW